MPDQHPSPELKEGSREVSTRVCFYFEGEGQNIIWLQAPHLEAPERMGRTCRS